MWVRSTEDKYFPAYLKPCLRLAERATGEGEGVVNGEGGDAAADGNSGKGVVNGGGKGGNGGKGAHSDMGARGKS